MKLILLFFAILWLAPALVSGAVVTPPGPPPPPEDAVVFAEHHYRLVDKVEDLSWTSARQACEADGAHLAVVTSAEEATFIAELCDDRYMYLGASDHEEERTWKWVDGTPWEFTHWMRGQPNDYSGSEDYLATYDGGEWVDVDHSGEDFWMPSGYICEWDR
jgi:hypothetical protein